MGYWFYQVNPQQFDMEDMLRKWSGKAPGSTDQVVFQPRRVLGGRLAVGDMAFLCETDKKKNAGVLGLAEIRTLPSPSTKMASWQDQFWIKKDIDNLPQIRMKVLFAADARLTRTVYRRTSEARFASGFRATMAALSKEEAYALADLLKCRHLLPNAF